ncbi:MAG: NAD(P)/FAD-dependent oxidoreductase [Sediminibacterium sp. Gen4]|jgi:predicted Rossmann fold flavoprotein|uniref:NAD(P)/FAD-dependent oxidoreductase n=1 Tax=unclassified Sediminibacterium TaxID=2635961 RepID=UPI0015BB59D7|nr:MULTISPECIES: NAD(P)/FAD-dependent oxidoreductase [unclassified Sediminibacterium]MBW0164103.1 NAD(P)/FAD-dependent oxidoreductase [Sediminibacterium sp.]NWK67203.1 NAD(P)/FAD-dependent oxidoreductase [Sediminibacterium sp. Gen4]
MQKTLVVIGGGAAGFFCAVNAARMNPSLKVLLLEKSNKLLSKVKISGGGRCNTTHACFDIPELVKKYPRGQNFLKKSFHQFYTQDTIDWFEERGVQLKTEEDGRMFPVTDNSQTIIDCLLKEADKYKVAVQLQIGVTSIQKKENKFDLQLNNGDIISADFVCVATGGFPKANMFDWLTTTGHTIATPVPSLFTFNMPGNPITSLMGVSVERAIVKVVGTKLQEEGPLLITHWGMSGPVILRTSAWGARELADKNYHFTILVNWIPNYTEQMLRDEWQEIRDRSGAQKISNKNPFGLPNRLWLYLLQVSEIDPECRWSDLPAKQQNKLIKQLTAQEFLVQGKTTFKDEFVTAGGILLSEIDPQTMQSRKQPGLFFAGEVMDVDGITGGFNFQHAWTSGFIAAKAIAAII